MANALVQIDYETVTPELLAVLATYPDVEIEMINAPVFEQGTDGAYV